MFSKRLLSIYFCLFISMLANNAYALCVMPSEPGDWKNIDPNTRGITTASVRFQCQDQILNGELYPPGYPFYIKLWGSCTPTDCYWGEMGATYEHDGWKKAFKDHGFAKRYIWFKTYIYGTTTYLRVWIWTDFVSTTRTDYASDNWMLKQ